MGPGSSLCLVKDNRIVMILTVLSATIQYHVTDVYTYTWPQVQVSCYCTCAPTPCQLPQCGLCYNVTRISTPCSSSTSTSTTCCSIRLSHPHQDLTALKLGHSSLQVQYRLQTLSNIGRVVKTRVNKVYVGHETTAVHHGMGNAELLLHVSRLPTKPVHGWLIDTSDGLKPGHVNLPNERDSKIAGWLRVEDGVVRPPSRQLISAGVHVDTEDCRQQKFSADLTGFNLSPGTLADKVFHLSWDGQRTVTDASKHIVKMRMLIRSPGGMKIHGNQTRLGDWRATLVITNADIILNITTKHSQGLILGRVQNISFSFFVSNPISTSISSAIPIQVPGMLDTVTICLRVLTSRENCKKVLVALKDVSDSSQKYSDKRSDVQPIPVMWQLDSQAVTR